MHVPGGQVGQCPFSLVVVLHAHEPIFVSWQVGMAMMAGLDGGFLVGGDHVLLGTERLTLPLALIEVQNSPGFLGEVRVPRKDPRAVVERPDGVFGEPPPDGSPRNLGHKTPIAS
jgi:hypothetical protein